ncbi:gliding motility protein GldB-related protein, partial [Cesiribacter andamanensis]
MLFSYHRQFNPVYRFIFLLPLCLQLVACGDASEEGIRRPDIGDNMPEVRIGRLEQEVFEAKSRDEITAFLQENELFAKKFLRLGDYPHDSIVVNQLWQLAQNPHLDTVYQESQQVFPDLSGWEQEFATAFGYIQHYYPDFQPPQIYTMVTGFGTDLFISDEMDLVVIGLDYFMGPQAPYRPAELPQYIQRRYSPQ